MTLQQSNETTNNIRVIDGYVQIIRNKYHEFYDDVASRDAEAQLPFDFQRPLLFMITTTFNPVQGTERMMGSSKTRRKLDEFFESGRGVQHDLHSVMHYAHRNSSLLHNHICNRTVKNHFRIKNRKLLPLGVSFLDLSGSKYGRFNLHKTPHAHAIYLIHPDTVDAFHRLVSDEFKFLYSKSITSEGSLGENANTRNIQEVHVQKIPNTKRDLCKVVSYASKFHRSKLNQKLDWDTRSVSFDVFNQLR